MDRIPVAAIHKLPVQQLRTGKTVKLRQGRFLNRPCPESTEKNLPFSDSLCRHLRPQEVNFSRCQGLYSTLFRSADSGA